MPAACEAFSAAATQAGQDPVLPSYLDVFHAYLTSPKAAVAIRDAALDGANKAKPIGELLDKLVARDFQVFETRVNLTTRCKLGLAFLAWVRGRLSF